MRFWPFRKHKQHEARPSPDAQEALRQARRQLADTNRFASHVDEVADRLEEIRRRNHFADAVKAAMRRS